MPSTKVINAYSGPVVGRFVLMNNINNRSTAMDPLNCEPSWIWHFLSDKTKASNSRHDHFVQSSVLKKNPVL